DLVARLRAARIAYGAVNSIADLARHPQLRRAAVAVPGGTLDIVAPPARWAGEVCSLGAVPALDEHGPALRKEFAE
ncbi:MAG: CoA transferase, partial [Alphaproteobacteria bacterium]